MVHKITFQVALRVGAALSRLSEGAPHPECPSVKVARVKIISIRKATCLRKRNRRDLPYWLSQSFLDCSDKTEREPQRKMQLSPGKVGRQGGDSSLRPSGHRQCGVPVGLNLVQPSSCPRRCTPQTPLALQPPARALMSTGPPQPTPQSSPAVERPDRSGIGRCGVERSTEKRRGDVRPPRSRSHPKGESRKNDRLRGVRGGRRNAAGQAF